MRRSTLTPLFETGRLWQGHSAPEFPVTCSGFEAINRTLTGGGWPAHMLIEWLAEEPLCAPMTLAMAAWKGLTGARSLALVNPPCWPSAEGLWQRNIDPKQVDFIQTSKTDSGWCLEQLAKARSVSSVLAWDTAGFGTTVLRRLQLACQTGGTQLFLVRDPAVRQKPSPAPVRATLHSQTGCCVEVFKQPGAPSRGPVHAFTLGEWVHVTPPSARQVVQHRAHSAALH